MYYNSVISSVTNRGTVVPDLGGLRQVIILLMEHPCLNLKFFLVYFKDLQCQKQAKRKIFKILFQFSEVNYVSQFTVDTHCFADGRCLFKQPQSVIYYWNQYDEEI